MVLLRKKKDFQTKSLLLYSQKNKAKTFSNVPISVFKDKLERVFFKKRRRKNVWVNTCVSFLELLIIVQPVYSSHDFTLFPKAHFLPLAVAE